MARARIRTGAWLLLLLAATAVLPPAATGRETHEGERTTMSDKTPVDKAALKERLSAEQWRVTQEKGTEAPFTGRYWNSKESGDYLCVVCGESLFDADTKYDAGCGWPSFYLAEQGKVETRTDTSHGMVREEIVCAKCGAHLGHVFDDGPKPLGLRYCVNSASLDFEKAPDGCGAPGGSEEEIRSQSSDDEDEESDSEGSRD